MPEVKMVRFLAFREYMGQESAKRWALGCVNSPPPTARGSQEAGFTQSMTHLFTDPCREHKFLHCLTVLRCKHGSRHRVRLRAGPGVLSTVHVAAVCRCVHDFGVTLVQSGEGVQMKEVPRKLLVLFERYMGLETLVFRSTDSACERHMI